jgi:SAM-dependent methyltransferase
VSALEFIDERRFVVGPTTFQILTTFETMPKNVQAGERGGMEDDEFFLFKPRPLVEAHAALVGEVRPQRIFELGFYGGGSTLFLAELARPQKVVTIDLLPLAANRERLDAYAAQRGIGDVIRAYGEVDQADRPRLAQIVRDEFGDEPLDLVVDDASHFYAPTLASFNELFPRLRPGGVYAIEDWRWAHTPVGSTDFPDGWFNDEIPLTRLLFEIALAIPGMPGLIDEIAIETRLAIVRRGEREVDPATFDVTACSNPRGRALLAPPG